MSIQIFIEPALTLEDTKIELEGSESFASINPDTTALDAAISKLLGTKDWTYHGGYNKADLLAIVYPRANPKYDLSLAPIAVNHQSWNNLHSQSESEFEASLSDTVTIESSITWEKSVTAGFSFTAGIEVGGGPIKASASTSYSVSVTVGKEYSKSRSEAVGADSSVRKTIGAGKAAIAALFLERGTLTIHPIYDYGWTGSVSVEMDGTIHTLTGEELTQKGLYRPHESIPSTMVFDFDAEAAQTVIDVPNTNVKTVSDTLSEQLRVRLRDGFNSGGATVTYRDLENDLAYLGTSLNTRTGIVEAIDYLVANVNTFRKEFEDELAKYP